LCLQVNDVSVEETEDVDALTGRMVKLRNGWGLADWKGDWCNDDFMWEDYPSVREFLNPGEFADDGSFWMEWADFEKQFNQVGTQTRPNTTKHDQTRPKLQQQKYPPILLL
jgi:hypothetical protein